VAVPDANSPLPDPATLRTVGDLVAAIETARACGLAAFNDWVPRVFTATDWGRSFDLAYHAPRMPFTAGLTAERVTHLAAWHARDDRRVRERNPSWTPTEGDLAAGLALDLETFADALFLAYVDPPPPSPEPPRFLALRVIFDHGGTEWTCKADQAFAPFLDELNALALAVHDYYRLPLGAEALRLAWIDVARAHNMPPSAVDLLPFPVVTRLLGMPPPPVLSECDQFIAEKYRDGCADKDVIAALKKHPKAGTPGWRRISTPPGLTPVKRRLRDAGFDIPVSASGRPRKGAGHKRPTR
jgi:hypothetical protein